MALVVQNAAIVRLLWLLSGQIVAVNVLGVQVQAGTTISQALANAVGTGIKGTFAGQIAPHIATIHSLASVGIRDIRVANQVEFLDSGPASPGLGAGDPLPTQVSLVVSLRTALAGRSFRGRVFLPGFTEAGNDAQHLATAAVQSAAIGFMTNLSTVLTSNGLTLGVLSRPANAVTTTIVETLPNGTQVTRTRTQAARVGGITPVQSIILRNAIWDTQRRRGAAGSGGTRMFPLITVAPGDQPPTPA